MEAYASISKDRRQGLWIIHRPYSKSPQKGKLLLCWWVQHKVLYQIQNRSYITQVNQFDWRMRVAAGNLHFKSGNASTYQMSCRRIGHATIRRSQLVWHTSALRRCNNRIASSMWEQETRISRTCR